jgi:hypothetical protein
MGRLRWHSIKIAYEARRLLVTNAEDARSELLLSDDKLSDDIEQIREKREIWEDSTAISRLYED